MQAIQADPQSTGSTSVGRQEAGVDIAFRGGGVGEVLARVLLLFLSVLQHL